MGKAGDKLRIPEGFRRADEILDDRDSRLMDAFSERALSGCP